MTLVNDVISHLTDNWTETPALKIKDRNKTPETQWQGSVITVQIGSRIPERLHKPANHKNTKNIEKRRIYLFFKCQTSTILDTWMDHTRTLMMAKNVASGWWTFRGDVVEYDNKYTMGIQEYLEVKLI